MISGLYSVRFQTPLGAGAGVVYAQDGQLWGGDSGIYYRGSFQENGGELTATINVDRHASGMNSVFGVDKAAIHLKGRINGTSVSCSGTSPQAPGVAFTAALERISD